MAYTMDKDNDIFTHGSAQSDHVSISVACETPAEAGSLARANTVQRRLKSRHMQFYAIGGTIGTGLFVGIGGGLATAGPLSLLLGYTITSLFIFSMVSDLALFPILRRYMLAC